MTPGLPTPQRILAVRLDNAGDVVMLTPALRELKRWAPAARLTLCCSPAGSAIAPLLPWVDDVVVHRALWQEIASGAVADPERERALVEVLRARRVDVAFVFTSFSQSPFPPAFVTYLAGVPARIGSSKEFGGGVLTHPVPPLPDSAHQVERNLDLLRHVGIPVVDDRLEVCLPPDASAAAQRLLAGTGAQRPYVVAAPGASAAARRYPPSRLARALERIAAEVPVVLVGDERDRGRVGDELARIPGVVDLMGRTSLPEVAAVIADAACLLACNSAPMHLADALEVPTVVLFSGTDLESQWAPRRARAQLLRVPTSCSPCHAFECRFSLECLDIPPDRVAKEVMATLSTLRVPG